MLSNTITGVPWQRHLERLNCDVDVVPTADAALEHLRERAYRVIILELSEKDGDALALSDYASYRCPEARVVFVTQSSFFSDGSIFQHSTNVCACLPCATRPDDLAAMVEHYTTH